MKASNTNTSNQNTKGSSLHAITRYTNKEGNMSKIEKVLRKQLRQLKKYSPDWASSLGKKLNQMTEDNMVAHSNLIESAIRTIYLPLEVN